MRKLPLAVLCLCVLGLAASAQEQDFSKIQSRITKVAGNIYMIDGTGGFAGGNIGVSVGDDGILIVDDQYAPLADKIQAALKGVTDKPVRFVLNTHFHGDHTNGNRYWGQHATIIAQDNVRTRMATGNPDPNPDNHRDPAPKVALPVITFNNTATVHINGEDIRAVHFPHGHTDGDAVVWFTQSNVVHMGDDFFNGVFPFIDIDSGGSVKGLMKNLEEIIPQLNAETKIMPGHGPLGTVDDLKKFLAMLKDSYAIVDKGVKQGKSLDQLKKENVLAKYDSWNWDVFKSNDFVEFIYKDITGQKEEFRKH
jgi:glyoxylase-like metal-dependent hydrolase (beta-lactamase superfamily II)